MKINQIQTSYLFCVPPRRYTKIPEKDMGVLYEYIAIDEFDKLISFEEEYTNKYVETPDLEQIVMKKNDRDIALIVFAEQPVIKIGNIEQEFTSSSYLFNPTSNLKHPIKGTPLMLPDFEVISLKGVGRVMEATAEIEKFYKTWGWKVAILPKELTEIDLFHAPNARPQLNGMIKMPKAEKLISIVGTVTDYNKQGLYFNKKSPL